ncbi:MAG: SGNH/GDSL hydrolase family protein [Saezia sp.]
MQIKDLKPLRNNCKQLALMVLGFVVCISLLEAKGFVVWAKRLEVSPTQQMILKGMEKLEGAWGVVAEPVVNFRPQALEVLTQHGWSDMPANVVITETPETITPSEPDLNKPQPEIAPQDNTGLTPQEPQTGIEGVVVPPASVDGGQTVPTQPNQPVQAITPLPVGLDGNGKLVPLPALKPDQHRHVVLAGDSMMAVGLAPQLQRELAAFKATSSTAKAYRPATGLARPDVFNWQKEYPLMIGSKKPDVVIVAIGGNDTQDLDVNKKVLRIGSDEWKAVYEERLTNYLNMLTKDGATVLWIKLPPMRPNKYNQNVTVVNEVAQKVVSQNPNAIWWDVSERFLNDKGKFVEFAVIPPAKRQVRIRQSDGIHLTDNGAQLISGDIIAWLNLETTKPPVVDEGGGQVDTPVEPQAVVL